MRQRDGCSTRGHSAHQLFFCHNNFCSKHRSQDTTQLFATFRMGDPSAKTVDTALQTLKTTITTASALIAQLQTPVASSTPNTTDAGTSVNALDLAHDTASLIRAHSTKLSLLIINKPFTASAITTVVRELVSGALPGLASAVELCDAGRYTRVMSEELGYHAGRVFTELETLLKAIPLDGQILSDDAKNGTGSTKGKGSLAMTGTVWQACDAVVELKKMGIAGLFVKKAEQYRATLKDALEELQEWGEETSDSEDDEDEAGSGTDEAQAEVDDIFGSQRHIPSEDPDKIRPRLESALKRLRLLITMYQAVIKRRFKTIPPLTAAETIRSSGKAGDNAKVVTCLDEVLRVLKSIPDLADEMASAFYELEAKEIDKMMDECFLTGFAASELLSKNWVGQEDEFSAWVSL